MYFYYRGMIVPQEVNNHLLKSTSGLKARSKTLTVQTRPGRKNASGGINHG
ncbi:hypothetical protein PMI05_05828 [Brevibacillus sp. BC25]|nr:hypothetical protein PMI05_05828 [Brevibacillus sp. BC25]